MCKKLRRYVNLKTLADIFISILRICTSLLIHFTTPCKYIHLRAYNILRCTLADYSSITNL